MDVNIERILEFNFLFTPKFLTQEKRGSELTIPDLMGTSGILVGPNQLTENQKIICKTADV